MNCASGQEPDVAISPQEAERVLELLCTKCGFCLSPLWRARLRNNPPQSAAKFTDTVFHAEGLNPVAADGNMYRAMFEEVRLAFQRSGEH